MAIVGSQRVANQAAVQDVMMQLGVTAFILLTVGFLFMFFGLNVLRSRASDVIGPGIASLVLAGLFAISFIVLIERMHMLDGRGAAVQSARSTIIVAMVVTFLIGLILGVCGLLALVERGNYLEWMKRSRRRDKAPSNTMSGDDFASSFG
jgi:hypothetical protein